MEIKICDHVFKACYFKASPYRYDDSLCLQLWNNTFGAIVTITKCLPDGSPGKNQAFVDENNVPGIAAWIEKNKLGFVTGIKPCGWCSYPLVQFDINEIEKHLTA